MTKYRFFLICQHCQCKFDIEESVELASLKTPQGDTNHRLYCPQCERRIEGIATEIEG